MGTDDVVIDPRDKKYFVAKPDPSFSPQRNAQVIQEVHDDTRKYFSKLYKKFNTGMDERIDTLAHFALYKFNKGGGKTFEQYVGKEIHRKIVGERLLEKVRAISTIDRLQGRTKVKI